MVRLSIEGYVCSMCNVGTVTNLVCDDCGWVDPLTHPPTKEEEP